MTSLISEHRPRPRLREVDRIPVAASPPDAWALVRAMDLYALPEARALFALRTIPERLAGGKPASRATIEDIVAPGNAFQCLGERPGSEIVVGAIGRFWKAHIPFIHVAPEQFGRFARPGYGKVVWSLKVDPRSGGGSWISVDLRVDATSDAAWRSFQRYWHVIGPFSRAIRHGILNYFEERAGAAPAESGFELPGDELLEKIGAQRTDAITIEAPPATVWPWLVQMGCRRAGWYSIDYLDNGGVKSAERIEPAFQHIALGDILPARPKGADGFAVLATDPPHALVLGSPSLLRDPAKRGRRWTMFGGDYAATWSFVLRPIGDDATRLIVRIRAAFVPTVRAELARPVLLAVHGFMERAQLQHLKARVESSA